jgi:hypothetical protein
VVVRVSVDFYRQYFCSLLSDEVMAFLHVFGPCRNVVFTTLLEYK